jgi:hypothetical protein
VPVHGRLASPFQRRSLAPPPRLCRHRSRQWTSRQTLGQGDEARVDATQGQIGKLLDQFDAAGQVGHGEIGHREEPGSERAQKLGFYRGAGVTFQEAAHLGNDQARSSASSRRPGTEQTDTQCSETT